MNSLQSTKNCENSAKLQLQDEDSNFFQDEHGIFVSKNTVSHRDNEYDQTAFPIILNMQRNHFWYRGRHRFLLKALNKTLALKTGATANLHAVDMGGGCGGWLEYLSLHQPASFKELALADSSHRSLSLAGPIVKSFATRYQIDLLDLNWESRWDIVFLLDVIEHIPEHLEVIKQVKKSLKPGGLLFVTAPALQFFWTYNDEFAQHQRRYSREGLASLAHNSAMKILQLDYFMFFLSPALYLSRRLALPPRKDSALQIAEYLAKTHSTPPKIVNILLEKIFSLEAIVANHVSFPWGTSILGVLQK